MDIETRIEKLERSNRIWKTSVLGLLAIGLLAGASSSVASKKDYTGITSHDGEIIKIQADGTMKRYLDLFGWVEYKGFE